MCVLLVTALSSSVSADQSPPPTTPRAKNGSGKIWLGVSLIAAGAIVMPLTGVAYVSQSRKVTGATLIGGGAGLVVWGTKDRQQAKPSPSVRVGVTVGDSSSIVFHCRW